uniref:Uncharacterized protein n=1 Tax=Sphaerodactylus townsendi TaxID=933632 RepID=A0ACB8ECI3_9SAUR
MSIHPPSRAFQKFNGERGEARVVDTKSRRYALQCWEDSRSRTPRFPYLDRPEERRILEALKQLYQCSAIDRRGRVTKLGEFMVQFPLPPTLACAVIQSISLGCEHLLLPIAAMLSVENVFIRPAFLGGAQLSLSHIN